MAAKTSRKKPASSRSTTVKAASGAGTRVRKAPAATGKKTDKAATGKKTARGGDTGKETAGAAGSGKKGGSAGKAGARKTARPTAGGAGETSTKKPTSRAAAKKTGARKTAGKKAASRKTAKKKTAARTSSTSRKPATRETARKTARAKSKVENVESHTTTQEPDSGAMRAARAESAARREGAARGESAARETSSAGRTDDAPSGARRKPTSRRSDGSAGPQVIRKARASDESGGGSDDASGSSGERGRRRRRRRRGGGRRRAESGRRESSGSGERNESRARGGRRRRGRKPEPARNDRTQQARTRSIAARSGESRAARAPNPAAITRAKNRAVREAEAAAMEAAAALPPPKDVGEAAQRIGIEALHEEQQRVIDDVLQGRDVLMILPTGFGKSACYQVPSMVLPKPVVLVSPLLALLKDQHLKLLKHGVPCVRIDGTVRGRARRTALERIAEGGSLLVMTTPESLFTDEMGDAVRKSGISLAAIDEAHCISEWGHDFRPAYMRLGTRLRELGRPPLLALTATATERVREGIVRTLGMHDPSIVLDSPHRSNLAFEVIPCEGDMRLRALVRLVRRLRRPGIIYCSTRREVESTYLILRRLDIPAHRYHGMMTSADRESEQKKFMRRGRRTVMVATSAFGLGIDKPDIRYILHYQSPASLEQYVQEAGRGGRDGRKSNCILLHDPTDRHIHEALLARSRIRPDQLYRLGHALAAWDDEKKQPSLAALALSAELGPRIAGGLIAKFEEAGLVECDGEGVRVVGDRDTFEEDCKRLAAQFDTLRIQDARRLDSITAYARSLDCRAVVLREYFGEARGEPCGLCDVCEGRPERADGFFAPVKAPSKTVLVKKAAVKPKPRRSRRSRRGGKSARRRRRPRRSGGDATDSPS